MQSKYIWIIGGLSTALVGASSAAVAVPLVIKNIATNRAHDALSNFIDLDGGKPAEIDLSKRLNVVALGDSITSGYNGFVAKEMFSYADVLFRDLRESRKGAPTEEQRLVTYHNFSETGAKIGDVMKTIARPDVMFRLHNSDIITISISSNDLMAVTRLFNIYFDTAKALLFPTANAGEAKAPEFGDDPQEINKNISDILRSIGRILTAPDAKDAFLIDAPKIGIDVIKNVIKRGLMTLMRDLRHLAPKAHIKFIFPEFPFDGMPDWLMNKKLEAIGNQTLPEFYNQTFKSLVKEAVSSGYTEFIDFHDLFVNGLKHLNHSHDDFRKRLYNREKEFFDHSDYQKIINRELMHNLADIHPTNIGHLIAGNELFREVADELKVANPNDIYQGFDGDYWPGKVNVHSDFFKGEFLNVDELADDDSSKNIHGYEEGGKTTLRNKFAQDSTIHKFSNGIVDVLYKGHKDGNLIPPLFDLLMGFLDKGTSEEQIYKIYTEADPSDHTKVIPALKANTGSALLQIINYATEKEPDTILMSFIIDQLKFSTNADANNGVLSKILKSALGGDAGGVNIPATDDLVKYVITHHNIKPVDGVYSIYSGLDVKADVQAYLTEVLPVLMNEIMMNDGENSPKLLPLKDLFALLNNGLGDDPITFGQVYQGWISSQSNLMGILTSLPKGLVDALTITPDSKWEDIAATLDLIIKNAKAIHCSDAYINWVKDIKTEWATKFHEVMHSFTDEGIESIEQRIAIAVKTRDSSDSFFKDFQDAYETIKTIPNTPEDYEKLSNEEKQNLIKPVQTYLDQLDEKAKELLSDDKYNEYKERINAAVTKASSDFMVLTDLSSLATDLNQELYDKHQNIVNEIINEFTAARDKKSTELADYFDIIKGRLSAAQNEDSRR